MESQVCLKKAPHSKAWVKSTNETTARFAAGSFVSTTIKRGVVKAQATRMA